MTNHPMIIKVFISSPSDLRLEREAVRALLNDLNEAPPYRAKYKFLAFAFEDQVPYLVGESAQSTVDHFLMRADEADIVVCIMWLRMGTPLDKINPTTGIAYQSGTEYEFWTAYRAYQQQRRPKILLYRCKRLPETIDEIDGEQFERVKKFFDTFGKPQGEYPGMAGEFYTLEELVRVLRRGIEALVEKSFPRPQETESGSAARGRNSDARLSRSLPRIYIERTRALNDIRRLLLNGHRMTGRASATALTGMAGIGKTVLAQAISEDLVVQSTFPDGVLWANIGFDPDLVALQRDWIEILGGDVSAADTIDRGHIELRKLLKERYILLVLDNVWDSQHIDALNVGGPNCSMLITTRDKSQVVGDDIYEVPLLDVQESLQLLGIITRDLIDRTLAKDVINRAGHLPLTIALIGAQLTTGGKWSDIKMVLDKRNLDDLGYRQTEVLASIKLSVDHLPSFRRERYQELIIFPRGQRLAEAAVERLWQRSGGLEDFQSRLLLTYFQSQSLIQSDNTIHDLLVDYLQDVVPKDREQELHSLLVDSYGGPSDWSILPDDDYAWRNLAFHVAAAHRLNDLHLLLTNCTYVQTKYSGPQNLHN